MTGLFLLAAAAFLLLRQRVWQVSPTSHEGFGAFPFRFLGDKPLGYFVFFPYPLALYCSAITYGRSRLLGNFCYDLLLTFTGIAFFLAGSRITGSDFAAFCGGGLFYAAFAARQLLGPSIHLEAYTYFFAALGLLGVALALENNSVPGVFAAMLVASLSFWSKLTAREALWPLALVFFRRGLSAELLAAFVALGLMGVLFLWLLSLAHRHVPAPCLFFGLPGRNEPLKVRLGRFLAYQKHELALHYGNVAGFSWRNILRQARAELHKNLGVFFPVAGLFLAHFTLESVPWETKALLLLFLIITATNCLTRLSFTFLSWSVGVFPLGLGAGLALEAAVPLLAAHWASMGALAALACVMSAQNYCALTYWTDSLARAVEYTRHAVLPLKKLVRPQDHVFCNGLDVDIYSSLGCQSPPVAFLFMRYVAAFYLRGSADYRREFLGYFRENQPKYFIDTAKDLDLDYLEAITGLTYRLVREGYAHIYRLEGGQQPQGISPPQGIGQTQDDFDPARLYAWNGARHQREVQELRQRAAGQLAQARELLAQGDAAGALGLTEDVLLSNTGLPELRLVRAKCLLALGRGAEALVELRLRLGGSPEDAQARALAEVLTEELAATAKTTPPQPLLASLKTLWTGMNGGARAFDPLPLRRGQ